MSLRNAKYATPEAIQALAEQNLVMAVRIKSLEGMIRGLMDAMRPLLDEWEELTKNETTPD